MNAARSPTSWTPDIRVGNVRDEAAVQRGVAECLDRFGRIDALMNVAGISARSAGGRPVTPVHF